MLTVGRLKKLIEEKKLDDSALIFVLEDTTSYHRIVVRFAREESKNLLLEL